MINEIRVEELHPLYQHIAKIIGLENALKLGSGVRRGDDLFPEAR